jgi:hypothetical protein
MSLNKFTSSAVRKQWMNINANEVKCASFEVDDKLKLTPMTTYSALDVSNISTLWTTDPGMVIIESLAGGSDGQIVHIMVGGFGGQVLLKEQLSTGAPGEQLIMTQLATDILFPVPPATVVGYAKLLFDEAQNRWLAFAE